MDSPSNLPSAKMIVKTLLKTYAPPEEVESIINHEHLRYEQIVDLIQKGYDFSSIMDWAPSEEAKVNICK